MVKKGFRKSIFDLESRVDLVEELHDLREDMKNTIVSCNEVKSKAVISILDESITDWPYREGSSSIHLYMRKRLYSEYPRLLFPEDENAVFYFELYLNLLHWAPEHYNGKPDPFDLILKNPPLEESLKRFIENITFVLEKCNMNVREDKVNAFPQYIITKRDAQVDTTIDIVPELSEVLLSYLDIRNQHDEVFKKNAIKTIADYLEPKRKTFKGTGYSGLCDYVFYAFNRLGIRHNNKEQVTLKKSERMKLYDVLFRMTMHLIQKEKMDECMSFIEAIKTGSDSGESL